MVVEKLRFEKILECSLVYKYERIPKIIQNFSRIYQRMLNIDNCYRLLQIDQDCSDLQLRRRYRKCALQFHPDRNRHNQQDDSDLNFIKLSQAYKKIVRHRKYGKMFDKSQNTERKDGEGEGGSFGRMRQKLKSLQKTFDGYNQQFQTASSNEEQLNRVFDEHMGILQSLRERLQLMKSF